MTATTTTSIGDWEELRLDRLDVIRASRRDALTGLTISAKVWRKPSNQWARGKFLRWRFWCISPDYTWEFDCGKGGTGKGAIQDLLVKSDSTPLAPWFVNVPMRRFVRDLSAAMAVKYAGTLFRVLRRRAFCSAIRARVRAKLILRSPSFGGLPDVLILDICRRWLQ